MAISPSDTGSQSYSSLRNAVDRILGTAPGGTPGGGTSLGWSGEGSGAPQQSSDIVLGQQAGLGTISAAANTPFEDPNTVAARQAVEDAKATTAAMQAQYATPVATSVAASPAVTPAVAATAPTAMISRAGLYELQKQQAMNDYDAKKQQQISALQATGMYRPDQLNFGATNWGTVAQPANWGKAANYMNTSMVPNPYAKK